VAFDETAALADVGRYFDNVATTPLDPRVLREMMPFLASDFGNPNSIHAFGLRAREAVELARQRVAFLLDAEDPSQIIFTSGATESNNQILGSFATGAYSPFEHSAVREPATHRGMEILANDGLTIFPPSHPVEVISLMMVNNEIGAIWDPGSFSHHADCIHSDVTQAVGKIPLALNGITHASFSAHKFYGPKGVGGIYFQDTPPKPMLRGGEQENGIRGGTLNVPGIVGMGVAAQIAADELESAFAFAQKLRSIVVEGLDGVSDWQVNGGDRSSPYILSMSFLTIEGETLVVEMDRAGYAISSGAACSSHSLEPSHVLTALELEDQWLRGTVRVSFGRFCSVDSAHGLSKSLRRVVEKLRTMY